MPMKPQIRQKIADLNAEAEQLVSIRDQLTKQLSEINTRITQIVGAVKALNDLLIKEEQNEETRSIEHSEADKTP